MEIKIKVLKEQYSNLGLSEETLRSVAPVIFSGMSEDSDESAIAARARESYVSDMLKGLQSQMDRLRTPKKDETKKPPKGEGADERVDKDMPEWAKSLLDEQRKQTEALQSRLEALEGESKTKTFDELVSRVGKELHLQGDILDLCKQGLSSDMDEKAVRNALGAMKQILVSQGVHITEGVDPKDVHTQEQAEMESAKAWAKEHEIK